MNNINYIKAHLTDAEALQYEPKKDIKAAFFKGVFNDNYLLSEPQSYFSSINIIVNGSEYIQGYYLTYSDVKDAHTLDFFKCKVYHTAARYDEGLESYFNYNGIRYFINDFLLNDKIGNILPSYKLENKITLSNLKNISKEDAAQLEPQDADTVRELILSAENDGPTYELLKQYKVNTLDKKIKNNSFIYGAALQGIKNILDKYIKDYIKNYCSAGMKIKDLLTTNDRVYIYDYFLIKWLDKNFN